MLSSFSRACARRAIRSALDVSCAPALCTCLCMRRAVCSTNSAHAGAHLDHHPRRAAALAAGAALAALHLARHLCGLRHPGQPLPPKCLHAARVQPLASRLGRVCTPPGEALVCRTSLIKESLPRNRGVRCLLRTVEELVCRTTLVTERRARALLCSTAGALGRRRGRLARRAPLAAAGAPSGAWGTGSSPRQHLTSLCMPCGSRWAAGCRWDWRGCTTPRGRIWPSPRRPTTRCVECLCLGLRSKPPEGKGLLTNGSLGAQPLGALRTTGTGAVPHRGSARGGFSGGVRRPARASGAMPMARTTCRVPASQVWGVDAAGGSWVIAGQAAWGAAGYSEVDRLHPRLALFDTPTGEE